MYHIAICDDDRAIHMSLRELLDVYAEETDKKFHIMVYDNGNNFLEDNFEIFDLIFMDIKMKEIDGLKTAEILRDKDREAGLFFLTAFPEYVWQGYNYNATSFLLKPLQYARLKMELDRFFRYYCGKEARYFNFSNHEGKYKVLYKELRFVETNKRNVMIHYGNQKQIVYKTMREIAGFLEQNHSFIRSHGSFVVNLAFVQAVEKMEAVLTTGERIPISQPRRKVFMEKLTDYWGDML